MKRVRTMALIATLALSALLAFPTAAAPGRINSVVRLAVPLRRQPPPQASGSAGEAVPERGLRGEIAPDLESVVEGASSDAARVAGLAAQQQTARRRVVNRSLSRRPGAEAAARVAPAAPESVAGAAAPEASLLKSFNGLTPRDQRLANGGNQFTVEPPDQALCVGNGYVLESVNTVLRVFDTSGNPRTGVIDLNSFYGYPAQFNRTTGEQGPFITDPVCYFDPENSRFVHVVLTLDVDPATGDFLGSNHLDVAVSQTGDPTGGWNIYSIPVQNDGTQGTPDHGCPGGPCIGDYPHIGADRNGVYITTNEYPFFADGFNAAQLYALPKAQLAAGASTLTVVLIENLHVGAEPGFTVWPAISPPGQYANRLRGTEYFLSTNAAEETGNATGFSNQLIAWALTNTSSLNTPSPALGLFDVVLPVSTYGVPPPSDQKPGPVPLAECLNDTTLPTPFGSGCWRLILLNEPPHDNVEGPLDSLDSRMQQVWYAGGRLYGAHGTVVNVGGEAKAGIAYYVLAPQQDGTVTPATRVVEGRVAVPRNNVIMPAIAVLPNGRGALAFTLAGQDYYPTAAYTAIEQSGAAGPVQIAAAGPGPQDGFSEYNPFSGSGVARPRWGDYGAAVTDGSTVWIASEYIGQRCSLAEYVQNTPASPLFSCGRTRVALGNWYTRLSQVRP
jgi:hypothetical protein